VKIKDLAIKKRSECREKMVCVPNSIVLRDCNAEVYSIGILILQLVLGIDLFYATVGELQQVETHTRDLSPTLMTLLELIFSTNCTIDQVFQHEFFTQEAETEFCISTPISVHFTDTSADPSLITADSINLACFEQDARRPYFAHVAKLLVKDEQGKTGIRLMEEQLVALIDQS